MVPSGAAPAMRRRAGLDRLESAQVSAKRVRRLIERLERHPQVRDPTGSIPLETRLEIQDMVATATGEITAVIYLAQSALIRAREESGMRPGQARNGARGFRDAWLRRHYFMRGLWGVRQLNIHEAPQSSGRIVHSQAGGAARNLPPDYWTHPAISEELNSRLTVDSRLEKDELARFSEDMLAMNVIQVLEKGLDLALDFVVAVRTGIDSLSSSESASP